MGMSALRIASGQWIGETCCLRRRFFCRAHAEGFERPWHQATKGGIDAATLFLRSLLFSRFNAARLQGKHPEIVTQRYCKVPWQLQDFAESECGSSMPC